MIEGSGSGSIPMTSGSGSGRPKCRSGSGTLIFCLTPVPWRTRYRTGTKLCWKKRARSFLNKRRRLWIRSLSGSAPRWYLLVCDHWLTYTPRLYLSVYGPPRLHFETLMFLNFNFIAKPGPGFHSNNEDPGIQLSKNKRIQADPDPYPQPWKEELTCPPYINTYFCW